MTVVGPYSARVVRNSGGKDEIKGLQAYIGSSILGTQTGFFTRHLLTTDFIDIVNVAFLTEEGLAGLIKRGLKRLDVLMIHIKGDQPC